MFLGQASVSCRTTRRAPHFKVDCAEEKGISPIEHFSIENPLFFCLHESKSPDLAQHKTNVPCALDNIGGTKVDSNCVASITVTPTCPREYPNHKQ